MQYRIVWISQTRVPGEKWSVTRHEDILEAPTMVDALRQWSSLGWCNARVIRIEEASVDRAKFELGRPTP